MNKKSHIILLFIVTLCLQGCATKRMLDDTDKAETYLMVNAKYINAFISNNKIATLCFSGHSETIGDYTFKAKIPIADVYDNVDRIPKRYRKLGISSKAMVIKTVELNSNCDDVSLSEKIIEYKGNTPKGNDEWVAFSQNHKDKPLYISDTNNNNKWATLYIPRPNNISHNFYISSYTIDVSCKTCYVGVPFAFVFDVITFPLQAIGYFIISAGMQH